MAINGYTNQLNFQPGETIQFKVSSDQPKYTTQIVRLIHGDTDPKGPGFKYEKIDSTANKIYKGRKQEIHMGSYIKVEDQLPLREMDSFSLQAMILPTTVGNGKQAILSKWDPENELGFGLFIDDGGCLSLWIGDARGTVEKLTMDKTLIDGCWFFVGASFDAATGMMSIFQEERISKTNGRFSSTYNMDSFNKEEIKKVEIKPEADNHAAFVIGSVLDQKADKKTFPLYKYNGKIERPILHNQALTKQEMAEQLEQPSGSSVVGAWNFSKGITQEGIPEPDKIYDESENQLHGVAINTPMRAATGYRWTGKELNFIHAPEQYGAIHFHDDDLTDANWDVDFEWQIPESLPSGVYAAHVHAGELEEDYIVFFVRPKKTSRPQRPS